MTLTTFKGRFPEFQGVPDVQVEDAITRATAQTGRIWKPSLADESIGYLAAHFLAMSPFGQQARLAAADGNTTYMSHYKRLRTLATCGAARVAGVGGGARPGVWRR